MKKLVFLTSAFLMTTPVVGFAQGSAGKPVATQKAAAVSKDAAAPTGDPKGNTTQQKPVDSKMTVTALRPAPDFEVMDAKGQVQKLSSYKGKWVVLEWTNPECPFVKKHYSGGNMQKLQRTFTERGVIWLSVHTSAKGKEGYLDSKAVLAEVANSGAAPTASLMDSEGKVGKAYEAKNTPHMFVINPAQQIIYAGAIDDNSSPDAKVIPASKNYVATILNDNLDSPTPATSGFSTRPYGCSVKY